MGKKTKEQYAKEQMASVDEVMEYDSMEAWECYLAEKIVDSGEKFEDNYVPDERIEQEKEEYDYEQQKDGRILVVKSIF